MNNESNMQRRVPYDVSEPRFSVAAHMVTTAFELPGFRVVQNLGVVRGIIVRSRNIFANIGARYDATEIASGATKVLACGTAVVVKAVEAGGIYNS